MDDFLRHSEENAIIRQSILRERDLASQLAAAMTRKEQLLKEEAECDNEIERLVERLSNVYPGVVYVNKGQKRN